MFNHRVIKKYISKQLLITAFVGIALFFLGYMFAIKSFDSSRVEEKIPFIPVSANVISETAYNVSRSEVGALITGYVFENFTSLLPVKVIYENDKVIAFWHPRPYWDKHIIIVPKKRIESISKLMHDDSEYLYAVYEAVQEIVKDQKLEAYTVTVNGGTRQDVMQIHFHLWSGGVR